MNICTIYVITNIINDKVYVGQTWQSLAQRWREHKSKNVCKKLYNSIKKHGSDKFSIISLVTTDNQFTADYLEIFWINVFDSIENGYNIKEGGSHGRHSQETKDRISKLLIGKKHSEETKRKRALSGIGRHVSEESRLKISLALSGKKRKKNEKRRAEIISLFESGSSIRAITRILNISRNTTRSVLRLYSKENK